MDMVIDEKIIDYLIQKNSFDYNIAKASEECQELGLILTQKLLKPEKVNLQDIIDEIGDVAIRLEVLKKLYDKKLIQARVDEKLGKFKKWIEEGIYKQV